MAEMKKGGQPARGEIKKKKVHLGVKGGASERKGIHSMGEK